MPAFDRITNERLFFTVRPLEDVSGTDLIAISTFDAFLGDDRRHRLSPCSGGVVQRLKFGLDRPIGL